MGQITRYNATQSDAALFAHTAGREIENYLPHAVQQLYEYSNQELKALALDTIACHSYLENHFIDKDVFVEKDGQKKAKGRSKWGTKNKVGFMRKALSLQGLEESDLLWEGSKLLDQICGHRRAKRLRTRRDE